MADRYCEIDPATGDFIVDRPDYAGPETETLKIAPDINHGLIKPRWVSTGVYDEGASQQQLDDRAAFITEQTLIAAARERLQTLASANKSIAGDIDLIERGVLLPLGNALVARSRTLRTAANALQTPGTTAAEVRTAVIAYATAAEQAEIDFLLAIKDIRDAITDRG